MIIILITMEDVKSCLINALHQRIGKEIIVKFYEICVQMVPFTTITDDNLISHVKMAMYGIVII